MVALYSITILLTFKKIFRQYFLLAGILIGVQIPALDIYTYNLTLLYKQPLHSLFVGLAIYLTGLLLSELYQNKFYKNFN